MFFRDVRTVFSVTPMYSASSDIPTSLPSIQQKLNAFNGFLTLVLALLVGLFLAEIPLPGLRRGVKLNIFQHPRHVYPMYRIIEPHIHRQELRELSQSTLDTPRGTAFSQLLRRRYTFLRLPQGIPRKRVSDVLPHCL